MEILFFVLRGCSQGSKNNLACLRYVHVRLCDDDILS